MGEERLTQSSFTDLFSCKSENRNQFNHYADDHFGHRGRRLLDLGINHESSNKAFDAFKDLNEGIVACFHGLERLVISNIRRVSGSVWDSEDTYG